MVRDIPRTIQGAQARHSVRTGPGGVSGRSASGRPRLLGGQAEGLARSLRRRPAHPALFAALLRSLDALLLIGAALMFMRLGAHGVVADGQSTALVLLGGVVFTSALLGVLGAYRFRRMRSLFASIAILALALPVGFAMAALLLIWTSHPPALVAVWLTSWWGGTAAVMVIARVAVVARIRHLMRSGALEHRIVLLGGGAPMVPVIKEIDRQKKAGRRLCGFFDERWSDRSPSLVQGYHKLGDLDDLIEFGRIAHIDTVLLVLGDASKPRLMELAGRLSVLPVDVRMVCDTPPEWAGAGRVGRLGRLRTVLLQKRPINDWQAFQKRSFDLVFASLALVLLAPVMAAVALAVRLESPGPILFRQKRHGYNNKPIWVWKFRSMYLDQCDASAVRAVRQNDSRVTRVGRIIRRTSLDELPQLFNVLGGEMSMVGPRPHATAARTGDIVYDRIAGSYASRHRVKPGITGWAQINGWRGELNTSEKIRTRVDHDLYYIEHWSLWLDLMILLRTPASLLRAKGAY